LEDEIMKWEIISVGPLSEAEVFRLRAAPTGLTRRRLMETAGGALCAVAGATVGQAQRFIPAGLARYAVESLFLSAKEVPVFSRATAQIRLFNPFSGPDFKPIASTIMNRAGEIEDEGTNIFTIPALSRISAQVTGSPSTSGLKSFLCQTQLNSASDVFQAIGRG
jgi:hypothetical protein